MIKAENLTKIFGGKKALDSVNVTIGEGSIYGLVGSNGSGKSTLLRLASGVYMPDGGSITANGEKIFDNPQIKARIAYLGDTPYFMPNASIKETADFYRRLYPRFDNTLYNRLLEIFPLDYKAKISTMSKGMQRQAALITAIASSPDYLLLDEAFDGLDVVIRKALKGILVEGVTGRNMTTVIASHNLRELEDVCDHVGIMHHGRMMLERSLSELQDNVVKVQTVLREETALPEGLNILHESASGKIRTLIVRGDREQTAERMNSVCPIFFDMVPLTLEEIFVYELGGENYDVKSILL